MTTPEHAPEHPAPAPDLDAVIGRFALWPFTDETPLIQAGVDSLSVLRIVADLAVSPGQEIGVERLVAIQTIGELKDWLREMSRPAAAPGGTA